MEIKVPIQAGDLELFGDDPYRSARSWHEAWMNSEARLAQLERVRAAAQEVVDDGGPGSPHQYVIDVLAVALSDLDSNK